MARASARRQRDADHEERAARAQSELLTLRRNHTWPDDGLPMGHFEAFLRGFEDYDRQVGLTLQEIDDDTIREIAATAYRCETVDGKEPPPLGEFERIGAYADATIEATLAGFEVRSPDDLEAAFRSRAFRSRTRQMGQRNLYGDDPPPDVLAVAHVTKEVYAPGSAPYSPQTGTQK